MHINRVILMGQVTDAVALSDTYAVFGLRVGDMKFPVYVFDPLVGRELSRTLDVGTTVQVDGCLAFDDAVQGGRQYVAVTTDRACQVRLADRSVFAAEGPPSLSAPSAAERGSPAGGVQSDAEPATPERTQPAPSRTAAPTAQAGHGTPGRAASDRPVGSPNGVAHDGMSQGDATPPVSTKPANGVSPPANGASPPRPGRPRMGGLSSLPQTAPRPEPAPDTGDGDGASNDDEDPIPF